MDTRINNSGPSGSDGHGATMAGGGSPVRTGLAGLDTALGGGLGEGLHVIGAMTSFGVTTLSIQIADAAAKAGRPVLLVSTIETGNEIISISASRISRSFRDGSFEGFDAYDLTSRAKRSSLDERENAILHATLSQYASDIAPGLHVMEADRAMTAGDIRMMAGMVAEEDGKAPLVVVDRLQELDDGLGDAARVLARLAFDFECPVWCTSRVNRSAYYRPVDLDSFDGPTSIVAFADTIIGLQPAGISDAASKVEGRRLVDEMMGAAVRHVDAVILKGHGVDCPHTVPLRFHPRTRFFEDAV